MLKMSPQEKRAVISLSSIMSLRMIGLFMVLPVFALYAAQLPYSTPTLVGFAIGIYGLSQAIFQIPFGTLSDKFGRRPIITLGLIIFALGSFLAASAHTVFILILGRALQGMGAVGGTILAYIADLTRQEQRTKAMAIAGISIGASFSMALFIGPVLTHWIPINALFYIAGFMGLAAIGILYISVPASPVVSQPEQPISFWKLLTQPALAQLNIGILILHAVFTATFVVLPINLSKLANYTTQQQWHLYLPALLIACVISLIGIGIAERRQQIPLFFRASITLIFAALTLFWLYPANHLLMLIALISFFTGFSLLEAFLPSLISRTAPPQHKGSALGLYSCAQFSGIFVGGSFGGWLNGQFGFSGVYLFCISLSLLWLVLAFFMQKTAHDFNPLQEQLQSN